ncbi:hypothetical protein AMELA_G00141800, partial [Ameiurus melas]
MCEFVVAYEKKPFHTTTKTTKTWPGQPTLKESKITAITMNHNTIKVTCEIEQWNGDKGVFIAELYRDNIHTEKEKTNEQCAFIFDDLYYLTEYEVKVYARNRNGNESGPYTDHCSTKYNDKAVIVFVAFLIVLTSVALPFVIYKIYLSKRRKSRSVSQMM